ncbi:hypothetical protein CHU98_g1817 [Xylaria longipes]|nr:hypothetical protein CHU98_g1817 [Xylaria longipes]
MAASLKYTLHHYDSQNYLQKLGVWEVEPANKGKYWVVYIHGGAWRDPRVAHETFAPVIDQILSTSPATASNSGAAPIAGTRRRRPRTSTAGARHPDHLDDVRSALVFLQRTYGFESNYVLVGHSAGGALTFQLLATAPLASTASTHAASAPAGSVGTRQVEHPVLPAAIVAFEGLYDFTGVNERFGGAYASFFRSAFGDDPEDWDAAAPIKFSGEYAERWTGGEFVLLGWSTDDTLVDEPEADNMARRLRDVDGFVEGDGGSGEKKLLLLKDLRGDHDEIWQRGEEVARMVWIALRKLGVGW